MFLEIYQFKLSLGYNDTEHFLAKKEVEEACSSPLGDAHL
jgi:hypothetical protein